ncbi:transcription elongation factor Spt5 [Candidatus Micrarchaeota archaeon]|nr:transcription elongation factor Spt5 [Candidatus Micrarchaeota archaeon]
MLLALRVTTGQERIIADLIYKKAKKDNLPVYAVLAFDNLKGYIIVEAEDHETVRKASYGLPHIRGLLSKEITLKELDPMIEASKPKVMSIHKGDIIEIIGGPFKGERAKVIKVDKTKEELTVELTEAAVPIPVTIKANTVKLIEKAESAEEE